MFKSSVCSYPGRGQYGDNKYRGNCTGHIIKDFVESYLGRQDGLFADPSIGGGTSADVARELGLRFKGADLNQGYNILTEDFRSFLSEEANIIFWHPPYWNMILYSGNQWGAPDRWDLSRMMLPEFLESLELAIMNIHDACENGGHYGVLMGNLRRNGEYYNLSSLVERVSPGKLVDEVIKVQHNCTSDRTVYSSQKLVRIAHEKLLVFRKEKNQSSLSFLAKIDRRAKEIVSITWKVAIRRVLQGKTLQLAAIYQEIAPYAEHRQNNHWQAKVRQVLQDEKYFERVELGLYRLVN